MRYFVGGFTWNGVSQLDRFLEDGVWENGYQEDKYSELFSQIKVGDSFALKSTFATGRKPNGKSVLRIKNIGFVTAVISNSAIKIDWKKSTEFDLTDIKWYANTLEEISFPGDIERIFGKVISDFKMDKKIELLKYKKQIILQGPPGTGKTREAKGIGRTMVPLNYEIIKNKIAAGKIIPTAKGQVSYKVLSITSDKIILEREKGTTNETTISQIIKTFNEEKWNNEISNNDDRMAVALAKYLYDDFFNDNEQFKLIQFHPSYTYEDFVRGIVADSNGERIEYKNVNKTLGAFAELALKNYKDSKKDVSDLSLEKWIDEEFSLFVNTISETLEKGKIKLTDNVGLVDIMEDAFLYIGENWKGYEHRMSFTDIKRAYIDKNVIRQDIVKNQNLSGSARQHATYYIVVLKKFEEFLWGKTMRSEEPKVEEKAFILVIDEINRANLSSVLGELIYAMEYRGEAVESMYKVDDSTLQNKKEIILPPNLYIIGTMNTADRSVGYIDYAIRRRFAFVEVLPEELNDDKIVFQKELFKEVSALFINNYGAYIADKNTKLERAKTLAAEFRPEDVWLGHSYFIQTKEKDKDGKDILVPEHFSIRLEYEIKPILMEYVKDGILINTIKVGDKEIKVEDYIKAL